MWFGTITLASRIPTRPSPARAAPRTPPPPQGSLRNPIIPAASKPRPPHHGFPIIRFIVCEGDTPLPKPNQPKPIHPPVRQHLQFFLRNLVQPVNMPLILPGKLLQPDIGTLRNQHHIRHPRLGPAKTPHIRSPPAQAVAPARPASPRRFLLLRPQVVVPMKLIPTETEHPQSRLPSGPNPCRPLHRGMKLGPDRDLLLAQRIHRQQDLLQVPPRYTPTQFSRI